MATTISGPRDNGMFRLAGVAVLVASADALFYGHPVGISLPVFMLLLAVTAIVANRPKADDRILAAATLLLSLLPAVETSGLLQAWFAVAGAAAFALVVTGNARVPWPWLLRRLAVLLSGDPCGAGRLYARWRLSGRSGPLDRLAARAARWLLPLLLGLVFVVLFSVANPLFRSWARWLNPLRFILEFDLPRLLFWLLVAGFVRSFIRVPAFARPGTPAAAVGVGAVRMLRLGDGLVVRSLLVVNAVFALQTILDLVYLWGDAEPPEGVTPAGEAQEAAYLLVVSALLAAAFVLFALRGRGEGDRLVRALVYLWVGQNVVIVLSAILRLDLYVELYSLTRLRFAAFVWMALVAAGLVLIVARMLLSRSNAWLVKANLVSLGMALYGCSLVDPDAIVANYNVEHSRERSGQGVALDQHYLCSLGPSALPAIETFMGVREGRLFREPVLAACAREFRLELSHPSRDWRGWTYRRHRLRLYLAGP